MKRTLITGSSGFIGANLTRRLIKDGHQVHVLLQKKHNAWRISDINKDTESHIDDITDRKSMLKLFKKVRPQWVFHLAAFGAYPFQTDQDTIIKTNIIGTVNLVNAAVHCDVEAFINTGSSSEYGHKNHPPDENEPLFPNSHYALSKAYTTLLCRHESIRLRKKIITLRPYSVYGPYEEPTRFIPNLIIHGLNGKLPKLVDPLIARDYIHVDDFVEACLRSAQKRQDTFGRVFNVGTGRQTTIRQAVSTMKKILSISEKPRWGSMKNRIWDTTTWVSDPRLIKKTLGWEPKVSFEEGLRRTVNWFLENPSLLKRYQSKIL